MGVITITLVVYLVIWSVKKFILFQSGERLLQFHPGYEPCCPPGLGCNDPKIVTTCFRMVALRNADGEEIDVLNRRWSEYNLYPSKISLAVYADYRDMLVTQILRKEGGPRQLGVGTGTEKVSGVVEASPPRSPKWKQDPKSYGWDKDEY